MRWASPRAFLFSLLLVCSGASIGAVASRAQAQSDASSDADARRYFEEGRAAYDAGDFDAAVRGFRRAYLLSARPALLYNIGQAELRAGHDALALEALEGFVRQAPADDARRGEVEERVRVLRSMGVRPASEAEFQAAQQQAGAGTSGTATSGSEGTGTTGTGTTGTGTTGAGTTGATVTTGSDTSGGSAPTDEGPGVAPWIVVGVGGALLVAGAVLMGVGASEASRVTSAGDGESWRDLEGVASGAQTMFGVGIALLGVGAAAAAAGVVWAVLPSGSSESGATARLRLAPGALFFEGEF